MKAKLVLPALIAAATLAAVPPAFAQTPPAGTSSTNMPGQTNPAGSPTMQPTDAPSAPNPNTGVLQPPPPGAPPSNAAAQMKLPDCRPPSCGTPQIMTE